MKKIIFALTLIFSIHVFASDVDLKATMKQMKLEFKQAAQATSVDGMKVPIDNMLQLVEQAKKGKYPPEKVDTYVEGFSKLSTTLKQIDSQLDAGDLASAQESLRQVDELRVEYHDKRNPSIWSKIFG
ncbi:cytochrome b562 family protein [Vibrio sp. OCN044]|uniref:Cytochrome b562 family protein n=1 Tax=Vibrio tetraodonis subsp. pristinus TaxID=2695891 RepID=A0A6L8LUG4_9VIBR|nr:cytochrome b562 [Vibrio tetraodonis]MYM58846.1 cytochrome b562 family protein [Vibrio tetraodonis subsp. pristinus]